MANLVPVAKSSWILNLASIIVVISALYFAKALLVPIALAVLLSFALSPVCRWLESFQFGRIPAVLTTAFMGFTILGIVVGWAVLELASISSKIPEYQKNLATKFRSVNRHAEQFLTMVAEVVGGLSSGASSVGELEAPHGTVEFPFAVRIVTSPLSPLQVFEGAYGTLAEVFGSSAIVIVLVIFFLLRREDLRDRFIYLVGKNRVTLTTQTMQDAATRVSRYLSTLFLINLAFGISVGVGLHLIGIPSATLWGILAMTLRFVPYIGPWIAAAMPIGISFAISTGWMAPLFTVLLFVFLELLNNNILEPWFYGKNTGVSPVAVLVAAFFWMWLWGPIGLLLATPLTVCVLVVGKHVPELSFLDILLGSEQVFEMKERIYQRLLAGDQDKAVELFDEFVQQTSIVIAYDTILIPTLARAEIHWQLGELKEEKHKFILQSIRDIIQYRSERIKELETKVRGGKTGTSGMVVEIAGVERQPERSIICLPARTEADEITALMLVQLLEEEGREAQTLPASTSAVEMVESVAQSDHAIICVAATPPTAVMHSRSLVRRLYQRLPNVQLLVGLWDAQRDLSQAKERIGGKVIVVGNMADAISQIQIHACAISPNP
ncbi:AI-2E family transporter [Pirellulaceae bacterium SH467]